MHKRKCSQQYPFQTRKKSFEVFYQQPPMKLGGGFSAWQGQLRKGQMSEKPKIALMFRMFQGTLLLEKKDLWNYLLLSQIIGSYCVICLEAALWSSNLPFLPSSSPCRFLIRRCWKLYLESPILRTGHISYVRASGAVRLSCSHSQWNEKKPCPLCPFLHSVNRVSRCTHAGPAQTWITVLSAQCLCIGIPAPPPCDWSLHFLNSQFVVVLKSGRL